MELLNIVNKILDEADFVASDQGVSVDISKCQTAALQAVLEDSTPSNKTFDNGTSEVSTITFQTKSASTAGNYFVLADTAGLLWAAAVNKTGADPAPTGAVWASIASGRKVNVDISGATTAAQVAALFKTAFDALSANPFTSVDPADGTLVFTCTLHGNTTNAAVHNANDSGAGGLTAATTTPGTATEIDTAANSVGIPAHGYATGLKVRLTTTGTLPAGLATGTDYWIIKVDADNVKFASSLDNAIAGTAVDLTNQGSSGGVNTVAVTAMAGTLNVVGSVDNETWFDLASAQMIGSETEFLFALTNPTVKWIALSVALSAGQITVNQRVLGKGMV